jgi:uncharacterized protein (DUF2249 family)
MNKAKPVVRSDGVEFVSVTKAGAANFVSPLHITAACQATQQGRYREVHGFQWAYADQKPEVWPEKKNCWGDRVREVISSDGVVFISTLQAAMSAKCSKKDLNRAILATAHGRFRRCNGLQWAYVDQKPEVWPVRKQQEKKSEKKSKIIYRAPVIRSDGVCKWHSQPATAQDQWVIEASQGQRDGFFVEIGGYDGLRHSNTLALEESFRWTGLLVEADPELFEQARVNRPNCRHLNVAVAHYKGQSRFTKGGPWGGLTQFLLHGWKEEHE